MKTVLIDYWHNGMHATWKNLSSLGRVFRLNLEPPTHFIEVWRHPVTNALKMDEKPQPLTPKFIPMADWGTRITAKKAIAIFKIRFKQ